MVDAEKQRVIHVRRRTRRSSKLRAVRLSKTSSHIFAMNARGTCVNDWPMNSSEFKHTLNTAFKERIDPSCNTGTQIIWAKFSSLLQYSQSYRQSKRLTRKLDANYVPPITYYWTVPVILDHSCLVGKSNRFKKMLIQKCQDFRGSEAFVSAIFEFVKFPTRYEGSIIRGTVQ